jgi:hypothetical protein
MIQFINEQYPCGFKRTYWGLHLLTFILGGLSVNDYKTLPAEDRFGCPIHGIKCDRLAKIIESPRKK